MKKKNKEKIIKEENLIKYLRGLILRILTVIIIFLILAILSKNNQTYKDLIVSIIRKIIEKQRIKNIYTKYLGGIIPLDKVSPSVTPVFNEELEYTNESIYYDGVKLEVINKYLVPIIKEGMVIYIGEKENYGNVIIIEGIDGIEIWYGNIESTTVKLYDYVESGNYLGTTKDNYLYLVYSKEGQYLNYKDYLK